MSHESNKVIFIVGTTSSGKTDLAVLVSKKFNGEIISADSRQVYRGLDIGTGKEGRPNPKHQTPNTKPRIHFIKSKARYIEGVPQYLIDIVEPGGEMYNLAQFLLDANLMLNDIWSRGKLPVVTGGTGLYISALIKGYKLARAKKGRGQWRKHKKPDFAPLVIGIDCQRDELYKKIDQRLKDRLDQGLIAEVQNLIARGIDPQWLIKLGLEYRFVTWRLRETIASDSGLYDKLRFAIHAYARRQLTWIRHQIGGVEWVRGWQQSQKTINKFLKAEKGGGEI